MMPSGGVWAILPIRTQTNILKKIHHHPEIIANFCLIISAKINDGGKYDNKQKRVILSNIVNKQKQADLLAAVNGNSAERMKMPEIGTVVSGYRYKGGNVNDRKSWEKI